MILVASSGANDCSSSSLGRVVLLGPKKYANRISLDGLCLATLPIANPPWFRGTPNQVPSANWLFIAPPCRRMLLVTKEMLCSLTVHGRIWVSRIDSSDVVQGG